jgi:hypothetical protein
MFNEIQIERYEQDGTINGYYLVPLKFVPKSKAYMWVTEKGRDEQILPMMIVTMTGIDFDNTRMTSRHEDIRVSTDYSALQATYASSAIPYNISFSLQIYALHNVDIDQIYEQILPFFMPHAYIIINIPDMNLNFEAKVVLNSCSPMMTDDVTEEEARTIKWETQFQVQTYLFKPVQTVDIIGRLPFDISPSAALFENKGDWASGISYHAGDYILNDGVYYVCIADHVSSLLNEPPNTTYWDILVSPPAPSAWSNNHWTDGWTVTAGQSIWTPVSASHGGIITRFYTDEDTFNTRDVSASDNLWTDTAETLAIQPIALTGIDEDAKILLDMELFNAK